jgi:hypothetical protein
MLCPFVAEVLQGDAKIDILIFVQATIPMDGMAFVLQIESVWEAIRSHTRLSQRRRERWKPQ